MELEQILKSAGITNEEELETNMDGDTYMLLYEFWCLNGMPYGTMKARDGDPDQWMFDATCKAMRW